jgi:hypothetical protein
VPAAPKNIIQLRRELAEKFPGVRMTAGPRAALSARWPTGLPHWDTLLHGGLGKGNITEVVSTGRACGSALLLSTILAQAAERSEWAALIDGASSFDAAALPNESLERLLWLRCSSARDAVKAADLVLHDGTVAVAILDLACCPAKQLRPIPSSTWFRLQRLAENIETALLVLTSQAMVSNAEMRVRLEPRYSLDALDQPHELLLSQLQPVPARSILRQAKSA